MLRRWHERAWTRRLVPRLAQGVLSLLYRSLRLRVVGLERLRAVMCADQPFVFCLWHERIVLAPLIYNRHRPAGRRVCLMVSLSSDGELAARVLPSMGVEIVRGSADAGEVRKGGSKALRDIVRLVRGGLDVAFFPDGPHGPPLEVKHGVLAMARITGAPVLPVSWDARWGRRLGSWDRMVVPLPFSRVDVHVGEPVRLDPGSRDAESAEVLKQRLDELGARAAGTVGSARARRRGVHGDAVGVPEEERR